MPMYEFRCTAGHSFDRLVPLAHFHTPQTCSCGAPASRASSSDAALEAAIDSTTDQLIANLSARDKERLAAEMDSGLSAEIVRA